MLDFLNDLYPWTKTLHLLALISWMAALLYLPRLFVYHAERGIPGSELSETYKVMERRLHRGIMNPAMMATWVFGLVLVLTPGVVDVLSDHWFQVKFVCVVAMTVAHVWFSKRRKDFEADQNRFSGRTFRIMNEVPAVLLILIVVMVVVRPI